MKIIQGKRLKSGWALLALQFSLSNFLFPWILWQNIFERKGMNAKRREIQAIQGSSEFKHPGRDLPWVSWTNWPRIPSFSSRSCMITLLKQQLKPKSSVTKLGHVLPWELGSHSPAPRSRDFPCWPRPTPSQNLLPNLSLRLGGHPAAPVLNPQGHQTRRAHTSHFPKTLRARTAGTRAAGAHRLRQLHHAPLGAICFPGGGGKESLQFTPLQPQNSSGWACPDNVPLTAGATKSTETKIRERRFIGREWLGDVHFAATGLRKKGARITHPGTKYWYLSQILSVLISSVLCHFKQELKSIFPASWLPTQPSAEEYPPWGLWHCNNKPWPTLRAVKKQSDLLQSKWQFRGGK